MAISFACGDCAKKYKVDAKFAGKRIKCKECDATMTIPAADPSEAPPKSDLFDDWDTPETKPARKASKPAEDEFADDDDDMREPAAPPPRVTRSAPAPRKSSSAATGDGPKKKSRPKRESSGDGSPNLVIYTASGLVGGAIGAAVWGGICYATDSEIGWIAWGLGALVGFCVRVASSDHHDGFLPGIIAAGISVGSICAGKYMAAALMVSKAMQKGLIPPLPPGVAIGDVRFEAFKLMFGGMDILFFLLAIATAFKLGSGGGDD